MTKREKLHSEWKARQTLHKAAPEGRKDAAWGMLCLTTTALLEAENRAEKRGTM